MNGDVHECIDSTWSENYSAIFFFFFEVPATIPKFESYDVD